MEGIKYWREKQRTMIQRRLHVITFRYGKCQAEESRFLPILRREKQKPLITFCSWENTATGVFAWPKVTKSLLSLSHTKVVSRETGAKWRFRVGLSLIRPVSTSMACSLEFEAVSEHQRSTKTKPITEQTIPTNKVFVTIRLLERVSG